MRKLWALLLGVAVGHAATPTYDRTTIPPSLPVLYSQSYATLQALSDAVPATGGTMVIAPGTYTVSAVITLKSNTTVQCLPGATLKMTDAGALVANHWIFANVNYTATTLTDSNIKIRDCAFNGNSTSPSTGADAIRMVFVSDVEVTGNSFTGFGDATAFLGTTRTLVANNKATAKISNTCWDTWYAPSYFRIINNYCETQKHGIQITGTDTAQTSAGIAGPGTVSGNDVVLYSVAAIGAGVYLNSGALTDTGAGTAHVTVTGGRISTSGLGSSVGSCTKVSGSGSTDDWIVGVRCENAIVSVSPTDTATSYPANIHIRDVSVNITNTLADGAIQIKSGTSGVDNSRVTGAGYAYCINLVGATNQYAKNNSCVAGTDGTTPRVHADGTALASAIVIDPDETGAAAALTESAAIYNKISYRSPQFILGTASNGYVQYAGSNVVTLDETDASSGTIALRTDSGSGLANRLTVSNAGQVGVTIATGTAPFAISSSTNVANLNASLLGGKTFADPGPIGSGTPSTGAFTTLTSSSGMALSQLATQATNTIAGNATSGSAVPTALPISTCSASTSALIWTTNTGFGCNTVKATTISPLSFGTTAAYTASSTAYACPNLNNTGAGTNSGCLISFAGTLKNLYVWTSTTPGNTFNYLFTVMVGTPGSLSATGITCTISNLAQTCNDTTHTAAITAGQAWTIRIQPSASATTMSNGNYGLELDN